ncbi:hypothetical protein E8D34_10630 [Nocardioides sp. GY 10113]|uniref:hypothetical protein n=1 Tax=Nocardioides sp. GY 10113 TaxID=2569761 RepID=UPI0010A91C68|nr:hypothetical protein [Nocardioides sp. GY 10113]TIC86700.1 hypothetical protein E8D34_10630 [Nocardioides sp. GY 10113]
MTDAADHLDAAWPDAKEVFAVYDPEARAREVLDRVTAADVFRAAKTNNGLRDSLARMLGLSSGKFFKQAMAGRALDLARTCEDSRWHLLGQSAGSIISTLDDDPEAWARWTEGDGTALGWFGSDDTFAEILPTVVDMLGDALVRLGALAEMDRPGGAVMPALILLAGVDSDAAEALEKLAVDHPRVPRPPAWRGWTPPEDSCSSPDPDPADEVAGADDTPADAAAPSTADAPADATDTPNASVLEPTGTAPLDPAADWERASEMSRAVTRDIDEGRMPSTGLLEGLLEFAEAVADLAEELSSTTGLPVPAERAAILDALARLEHEDDVRTEQLQLLGRLLGVDTRPPGGLVDQLARLRGLVEEAVAIGEEHEAFDGLLALALLASSNADTPVEDLLELESRAESGLPVELSHVVAHAGRSRLSIPDEAPAAAANAEDDPAATADGNDAADPAGPSEVDSAQPEGTSGSRSDDAMQPQEPTASAPTPSEADEVPTLAGSGDHAADASRSTSTALDTEAPTPAGDALGSSDAANHSVTADGQQPEGVSPESGQFSAADKGSVEDLEAAVLADLARTGSRLLRSPSQASETAASTSDSQEDRADGLSEGRDGASELAVVEEPEADLPARPAHPASEARAAEVEVGLLDADRFGLASHLHTTAASIAARRLAAWAVGMVGSAGPVATAFSAATHDISRSALADDRAGQWLAWAAALRVSLISPAVGAPLLLTELQPTLADLRATSQVAEAFIQAAQAGAIALPMVSDVGEAEAGAETAADEARALLDGAATFKIKYVPATGVYKAWMSRDGRLGRLLTLVAANDPETVPEVLRQVGSLERDADRAIDDTFHGMRGRNKRNEINGGARQQLLGLWADRVDLARRWAARAGDASQRREAVWADQQHARPLEKLRRDLYPLVDPARQELRRHAAACPDPVESAAVGAAARMMEDAIEFANGHPPRGPEADPSWLTGHELLASGLPLTAKPLALTAGVPHDEVVAAIAAISDVPFGPIATYDRLASCDQHHLTSVLVRHLDSAGAEAADTLATRRRDDVTAARRRLAEESAAVEQSLRYRRRQATLSADQAEELAARLAVIDADPSADFPALRAELATVQDACDKAQTQATEAARAQVAHLAETNATIAQHQSLLLASMDSGDVAVALEYVDQLLTTGRLPETDTSREVFEAFYPAVPSLDGVDTVVTRLRDSMASANDDATVAALRAAADPDGIAELRPGLSAALESWSGLRKTSGVQIDTALRQVLAQIGFDFRIATREKGAYTGPGSYWRLSGVTGHGKALTPVLGSRASRTPNVLHVAVVPKVVDPAQLVGLFSRLPSEETVVVLYLPGSLSTVARQRIAQDSRRHARPPVIVVDQAAFCFVALAPGRPRHTLATLTLPFTGESPYADRATRTPREMFYGRTVERAQVMDLDGPSFVSGGRQLGKSALLWAADEAFDDHDARRSVVCDIRTVGATGDPERIWVEVRRALVEDNVLERPPVDADDSPDAIASAIVSWLDADDRRRLLIMCDEADAFLEADAHAGRFHHITLCKQLMESTDRRVKFVFAGLHTTTRFEKLPNQPLAHLGRPVVVGPLAPQPAFDLVTRPLAALGYRFADERSQAARVMTFTNSVPSLMQLFGQALVTYLAARPVGNGPTWEITDEDLTAIMDDTKLQAQFREKYLLTLNLDPRYKVIVYACALHAYADPASTGQLVGDLEETCRSQWPEGFGELSADHFESLAEECCHLGVLTRDGERYRLRTRTLLSLLGTEDQVTDVLASASERLTLPAQTDVFSHRALTGNKAPAPLTARQTSTMLNGQPRVIIAAGTPATGIDRVTDYLKRLHTDRTSNRLAVWPVESPTPQALSEAATALQVPGLLVVDACGRTPAAVTALLEAADRVIGDRSAPGGTSVVVLVDQASGPSWIGRPNRIEVGRLDVPATVMWCDEAGTRAHAPAEGRQVHVITSGWPRLLMELNQAPAAAAAVDWLTARIASRIATEAGARELLSAAGLGGSTEASRVLRAVFDQIAVLTSAGPTAPEDVAEVIALGDYDAQHTFDDVARVLGYSSVASLVDVLAATGALVTGASGITAEPLLAKALRVLPG